MKTKKLNPLCCKGRRYRYRRNEFINAKGVIEIRNTFTPLKRKSCPGCGTCNRFEETIESYYGFIDNLCMRYPHQPNDGEEYELQLHKIPPFGEFEWELVEITNNNRLRLL